VALAKGFCEEMAILKEGLIIEQGGTKEILEHPKDAYAKVLIESNFSDRGFRV
jgi:ABC-type dipeptide/oligopeptide/nickel transport system ATPase component